MMGDTRHPQDQDDAARRKRSSTHDPEFELPDPEQVDRDVEQAERLYREEQLKKKDTPAA